MSGAWGLCCSLWSAGLRLLPVSLRSCEWLVICMLGATKARTKVRSMSLKNFQSLDGAGTTQAGVRAPDLCLCPGVLTMGSCTGCRCRRGCSPRSSATPLARRRAGPATSAPASSTSPPDQLAWRCLPLVSRCYAPSRVGMKDISWTEWHVRWRLFYIRCKVVGPHKVSGWVGHSSHLD